MEPATETDSHQHEAEPLSAEAHKRDNQASQPASHVATEAKDTTAKAPWEGLYDTFMPLLISMTFNSPLQFWELNYMQQHDKFDLEEDDQDKLSSLAVWFGYEPILVALNEIKQVTTSMDATVLDIGCGNGHVCELLFALGFTNVYGLDYSDAAIRLAKSVRKMYREQEAEQGQRQEQQGILTGGINYLVGDALATGLESSFFDVVYDKGTFDSIACVSKKFVKSKKLRVGEEDEPREGTTTTTKQEESTELEGEDEDDRIKYCREVNRLLKPGAYFFITSQCHDEDELLHFFTRGQSADEHEGCDFVLVKNLTDSFADLRLMIFQKPARELDQD